MSLRFKSLRKLPKTKSRAGRALSRPQKQVVKRIAHKEIVRNQENKRHDTDFTAGVNNAGTISSLSDVTSGVGDTQRIGDSFLMGTISFKGRIVFADQYNAIRMIVFQWHEDSTPLVSDLLLTFNWRSLYNVDKHQKYKILFDKIYFTDNVMKLQTAVHGRVRIPRKKLQFNALTTVGTNKIYVCFISDSGGVPDPTPSVYFRLNYRDA